LPLCYRKKIRPILSYWLSRRHRLFFLIKNPAVVKSIFENCFYKSCRYFSRPHPFQLWIAPRHSNFLSRWTAEKTEGGEYNIHSPQGFDKQLDGKQSSSNTQNRPKYALFLYPDNLSTYWFVFVFVTVIVPLLLNCCIFFLGRYCPYLQLDVPKNLSCDIGRSSLAVLFFIALYHLIYSCCRKPILDNLWKEWPQTLNQKKEFQNVPSKITFCSKTHYQEYLKIYPTGASEKKYFCCCKPSLNTPHRQRPVYYSPDRSFQEAQLRIGIASFFAEGYRDGRVPVRNLLVFSFYYFAHIWVSYLWLFLQLSLPFLTGTRPDDSTMLHFGMPIIFWAIVTTWSLSVQFGFMNGPRMQYNDKLFQMAPFHLQANIRNTMQANRDTMQYLPKLLSIIGTLTVGVYLALVNLIMQADPPSKTLLQCKGTTSTYSMSFEIKKVYNPY
jgi:hypothetical protein